ncbi:hypothetical protein C8R46DRAFT_1001367 [Mycena filopes]|nr:hypothetical protein C8R46DRAFT_1001367 [Mycena filopes]
MDLTGSTTESYWRRTRVFLESSGYKLRPKFQPDFAANINELSGAVLEEYQSRHFHPHIMDAERISDGRKVMLKCVSSNAHPDEVKIAQLFSSPPHAGNPRNHCVPILNVLQDPDDDDKRVLVMPFLLPFHRPGPVFDTVGEVVDCFRQIFEGLQYMHENFVAHRFVTSRPLSNLPDRVFQGLWFQQYHARSYTVSSGVSPVKTWMDPLLEEASHPITRTECWPRYYIIDFGLSRQYDPNDGLPFEEVRLGGDRSPAEHDYIACNPFPTDIYFLGNILKQEFVYSTGAYLSGVRFAPFKHKPLRFLTQLVDDMTQENPADRPTIGEVIQRFDKLCRKLG